MKILYRNDVSLKAKSIYLIIRANPELFESSKTNKIKFLTSVCREGRESVANATKELVKHGLLHKEICRDPEGRKTITGSKWIVTEVGNGEEN